MMYMHYCEHCSRIHMLNGHKSTCPGCGGALAELTVSFTEFTKMDLTEREHLLAHCRERLWRCPALYK